MVFTHYEYLARRYILPTFGANRLEDLTAQLVLAGYARLRRAGVTPRTAHNLHAVLRAALNDAVAWELLTRNPAAAVKQPRAESAEQDPLSAEEAGQILSTIEGDRDEAIILLMLTCGLRQGEVFGLRWQDVDLVSASLHIQRTMEHSSKRRLDTVKTRRSRRPIPLLPIVQAALIRRRQQQDADQRLVGRAWENPDNLVFTDELGRGIIATNYVKSRYYRVFDRAGVRRRRPHELRHTFATLMLELGINPKIVSDMLGHGDSSVTLDIYSHVSPSMGNEAMGKLGALLAGYAK